MRKPIFLIAISVGLIDFGVKGLIPFESLPAFAQGWTWHLFIFALYLFFAGFIVWIRRGNRIHYLGVLTAFGLEDFTYYVLKSIQVKSIILNTWYFKTPEAYLITIGYCLLSSYIMIGNERWEKL